MAALPSWKLHFALNGWCRAALLAVAAWIVPVDIVRADEVAGDGIPEGYIAIEGDILVPANFYQTRGTYNFNLWPEGIVPYQFDPNVIAENQALMRAAMDEWESVAIVRFVSRTSEANYLNIRNSTGNSSYVGMIGGGQAVNIFNWNSRYVMCHELAHALGVWHEQSRSDRDAYVQINYGNIQSGYAYNFDIVPGSGSYGPYDFDSVMHYGRCAFSVGGGGQSCSTATQTITVLPPNENWQNMIGQRTHLSVGDQGTMVWLYPQVSAPVANDVDKNRYLTFSPNNGTSLVAIAVELVSSSIFPASTGMLGWVSVPDANGVSKVVPDRMERVWPEAMVHLGDCKIVPDSVYRLRAEIEGATGFTTAETTVATAARPWPKYWCDCVGSFNGTWSAPNGLVNVDDLSAVIQAFQRLPASPPITWVDVHPESPNDLINFADVQVIVKGFLGDPYPFSDPALCP